MHELETQRDDLVARAKVTKIEEAIFHISTTSKDSMDARAKMSGQSGKVGNLAQGFDIVPTPRSW